MEQPVPTRLDCSLSLLPECSLPPVRVMGSHGDTGDCRGYVGEGWRLEEAQAAQTD